MASSRDKDYRKSALAAYKIDESADGVMFCMVMRKLGEPFKMELIRAAHIYQRNWSALILDQLNISVNDLKNLLMLHKVVKSTLDCFDNG